MVRFFDFRARWQTEFDSDHSCESVKQAGGNIVSFQLDWGIALQAVALITIFTSAGFGMLALLTEKKFDQGRLTKAGRWAGLGIVVSAGLAVTTNILDSRKKNADAEKSRQQALQSADAANKQLDQIGVANRRVAEIQGAAKALQDKQDNALRRTSDLVAQVGTLRDEQDRATRETNQNIWRAANKLQSESFKLDFLMECMLGASAQFQVTKLNELFSDTSSAVIQVAKQQTTPPTLTEAGAGSYSNGWSYTWGGGGMLFWGTWQTDKAEFGGFRRVDTTSGLQSLDQLRSAHYWLVAKFNDVKLSTIRKFAKDSFVSLFERNDGNLELNCKTTAIILVNNVQIAAAPATMSWKKSYDDDGDQIGVIAFTSQGVIAPNAVPKIGNERPPR